MFASGTPTTGALTSTRACPNDRKYYSLERAKEVLGYEPRDDSADFTFGGEPKEDLVEEE